MCRVAREKVGNSIYHICARGNNKQDIFLDNEDREEYLVRLRHYQERYQMKVYAYCLMTNHIHLLVYDNNQDISRFMHGLSLSYVIYFNRKYGRTGHLFQDRFNSVIVKSDAQFIYVSKYIHLNPVRAKMVSNPLEYRWSSYCIYELGKDEKQLIDSKFLLRYFSDKLTEARKLYRNYVHSNIGDTTEEEIAIANDEEQLVVPKMTGLAKLEIKEILERLEKKWNKKIDIVMNKLYSNYKYKRMIVIYLVGLLSRKTYKEVSSVLGINLNETYQLVKRTVDNMIINTHFREQIEQFLNQ